MKVYKTKATKLLWIFLGIGELNVSEFKLHPFKRFRNINSFKQLISSPCIMAKVLWIQIPKHRPQTCFGSNPNYNVPKENRTWFHGITKLKTTDMYITNLKKSQKTHWCSFVVTSFTKPATLSHVTLAKVKQVVCWPRLERLVWPWLKLLYYIRNNLR